MNSSLKQVVSGAESLLRYIEQNGERSSAVLVREQARLILGHAEDFARAKADAALNAKRPFRTSFRSLRRKAHEPASQFDLSFQW